MDIWFWSFVGNSLSFRGLITLYPEHDGRNRFEHAWASVGATFDTKNNLTLLTLDDLGALPF